MTRQKKGKAFHGAGSMFQRQGRRKSWVVQLTIEGRTHNSYFYTKEEAEEYRARASYETKYEGVKPADRRTTVYAYTAKYLEVKTDLTPNVRATYAAHLERYLKESRLGQMKLADVEASHIRVFIKELVAAGKSGAYIQHIMTPLSQAFKQAEGDNTIPKNPLINVKKPQPSRKAGKALTQEEVEKLFVVLRADRYAKHLYPLFVLAFSTGARIGEILALRWTAVDLQASTLRIEASLKRESQGLVLGAPKTKNSYRTVPLTANVVDLLKQHKIAQNELRLGAGTNWRHGDFVFCTVPDKNGTAPGGNPLDIANIRRTWNRILKLAGLEHYRVYDTRHTMLTRLAEADVNPEAARLIAGHRDVRTTLSYYTHTTNNMLRDAVLKLPVYEPQSEQTGHSDEKPTR